MKLKNLSIRSIPGFKRGFDLADIHHELNIITGPNASGKTTICRAVRKLLWPNEMVEHFASASIHSEWFNNQETFTLAIENGNPIVSQGGKLAFESLPEEYLAPCFSITIDELFDGKDDEFIQKISMEIAGGFDVEAARKSVAPSLNAKSAISEWNKARGAYETYKTDQDKLRQEGEGLPALERKIKEARDAQSNAASLEKILKAKVIYEKIVLQESHLKTFPQPLLLSKVWSADWESYEQLDKDRCSLKEEIEELQEKEDLLKKSVGEWSEIVLAENELDCQFDRILRMEAYQRDKDKILIGELESDVKRSRDLLGIAKDEDIEKIQAEHLDHLDDFLADLEILDSEIAGIREQIRLNEVEENISSETLGQAAQLLYEFPTYGDSKSSSYWIAAGIALAIAGILLFSLSEWMRLLALGPFVPLIPLLIPLWHKNNQNLQRKREFERRYNALGFSPLADTSPSAIFKQLKDIVRDWGKAYQIDSQVLRKKDLEKSLKEKVDKRAILMTKLLEQAEKAAINQLPSTRLLFADILKKLHKDWSALQKAHLACQRISSNLDEEWTEWRNFADSFNANTSSNIYELRRIHERIKNRIHSVDSLKQKAIELNKKNKELESLEKKIKQLLERTECLDNSEQLKTFVNLLPEYEEALRQLKNLKDTFEGLKTELGAMRAARIKEDQEVLEQEKNLEEEKAKKWQELVEVKGKLKSQIELVEADSKGERLLLDQNNAFEAVRDAARNFARKELSELLITEAQKDFQRESQPQVLQKAIDWFQRFTKNKFKLEAPSTHTGSIVYEVIDTSVGERRTLDQLSRGTRMQLLMSVRLAFAFHNEKKGVCLPVFLDEVLANTDPERFDAIAEVIGELVGSGRQVFYLTCNPEDAWKWRQRCPNAHLIDLAKIQDKQAFLAAPLPITKGDPRFPKPSGQGLDEYVRELELPVIRIDEPIDMVSIHYLVACTKDLYRLLDSGIRVYGNLKHLGSDVISNGFPDGAALITRRKQLLEEFFALKTRGRGKALSREAVVNGGISKTFNDRIWNLAQELKCNAKSLIEFLEDATKKDDRKKGLRLDDREGLKNHLSEHGYLDERSILSDDEIRCNLLSSTIEEQDELFIEKLLNHTATKEGE